MRFLILLIFTVPSTDIVSHADEMKLLNKERDRQNFEEIDLIIEHMEFELEQEDRTGRRPDLSYPES
jgi:hypothetical protein